MEGLSTPDASEEALKPAAPALRVIVPAWLLCGAMDISAACLASWLRAGAAPDRVLKGVAFGMLGPAALDGGAGTAALGLAIHFTVALGATTVFYLASRRLDVMLRRPVPTGALYGIAVYLVMYWAVMPLSLIGWPKATAAGTAIAVVTHITCVGLPIALMVKRGSR